MMNAEQLKAVSDAAQEEIKNEREKKHLALLAKQKTDTIKFINEMADEVEKIAKTGANKINVQRLLTPYYLGPHLPVIRRGWYANGKPAYCAVEDYIDPAMVKDYFEVHGLEVKLINHCTYRLYGMGEFNDGLMIQVSLAIR